MDTRTGKVADLEEFIEEFGEDLPDHIVKLPADEKKIFKASNWGKRKRDRFAELLKSEMHEDEAFDIVENHRGIIPDES